MKLVAKYIISDERETNIEKEIFIPNLKKKYKKLTEMVIEFLITKMYQPLSDEEYKHKQSKAVPGILPLELLKGKDLEDMAHMMIQSTVGRTKWKNEARAN